MPREIRRVPADWEHDKDEDGDYIPDYERTPRKGRPHVAYQFYESTTEGTPLGPVFLDKIEFLDWMREDQGFDDEWIAQIAEELDEMDEDKGTVHL